MTPIPQFGVQGIIYESDAWGESREARLNSRISIPVLSAHFLFFQVHLSLHFGVSNPGVECNKILGLLKILFRMWWISRRKKMEGTMSSTMADAFLQEDLELIFTNMLQ